MYNFLFGKKLSGFWSIQMFSIHSIALATKKRWWKPRSPAFYRVSWKAKPSNHCLAEDERMYTDFESQAEGLYFSEYLSKIALGYTRRGGHMVSNVNLRKEMERLLVEMI